MKNLLWVVILAVVFNSSAPKGEVLMPPSREQLIQEALVAIKDNYVLEVDLEACRSSLLVGEVGKCLDLYSRWDSPAAAAVKQQESNGGYGDVPELTLDEAAPERVLEIDGVPVDELSAEKIRFLLRGEPGTKVEVKWSRGNETFLRDFVREEVVPAAQYRPVGDFGYIWLRTFESTNVHKELQVALRDLVQTRKVRGVVIDLRGNRGGNIDQALNSVREFAPGSRVIWHSESRNKKLDKSEWSDDEGEYFNFPVVIRQDEVTASAAEIFGGNMQILGAIIVGQKSTGKGVFQTPFILQDRSILWLTTGRWYLMDGSYVGGKGVVPDIQLDPALSEAAASEAVFVALRRKIQG